MSWNRNTVMRVRTHVRGVSGDYQTYFVRIYKGGSQNSYKNWPVKPTTLVRCLETLTMTRLLCHSQCPPPIYIDLCINYFHYFVCYLTLLICNSLKSTHQYRVFVFPVWLSICQSNILLTIIIQSSSFPKFPDIQNFFLYNNFYIQ